MAMNKDAKKINMLEIISTIKQHEPMTKSDIGKRTGLTNVTVNNFINALQSCDLVIEDGIDSTTGGRNASMYRFNNQFCSFLGLVIRTTEVEFGLLDFELDVQYARQMDIRLNDMTVEQGLDAIVTFVQECMAGLGGKHGKIAGLGISVPGPVNFEKGVIYQLTNISAWRNIPIKAIMEKRLGIPVIVDKDNYCNVSCLYWLRNDRSGKNIVYLATIDGVGSGVINGGKVYRGQNYIAGEIGHLSIGNSGRKCQCGNHDCMELYVSDAALVKAAAATMSKTGDATLRSSIEAGSMTMQDIAMAAGNGDAAAKEFLFAQTDIFVELLDYVIKAYDPDIIIYDSCWMQNCIELFNHIVNEVFNKSVFIRRDTVTIDMNEVDKLFLKGAASLILCEQFSLESSNNLLLNIAMMA